MHTVHHIPEDHIEPADFTGSDSDLKSVSVEKTDIELPVVVCPCCRDELPWRTEPGLHMLGRDSRDISTTHRVRIVDGDTEHIIDACEVCAAEFKFILGEEIHLRAVLAKAEELRGSLAEMGAAQ